MFVWLCVCALCARAGHFVRADLDCDLRIFELEHGCR